METLRFLLSMLSLVIPNYNMGMYLERAILSVIAQQYSGIELIVIDGGSTYCSLQVIQKYAPYISYWGSEPDRGQSDAINKGFRMVTGDFIAWLNSDDEYLPNAFTGVLKEWAGADIDSIFGPVVIGAAVTQSRLIRPEKIKRFSLFELLHFFYNTDYIIPSQSVFVRRELLQQHRILLLDMGTHYCMDLEWYCRILTAGARWKYYPDPIAFFRTHEGTKTDTCYYPMQAEARQIFREYSHLLTSKETAAIEQLLIYHRFIGEVFEHKHGVSLNMMFVLFWKFPQFATKGRQYWGLLKKILTGKKTLL